MNQERATTTTQEATTTSTTRQPRTTTTKQETWQQTYTTESRDEPTQTYPQPSRILNSLQIQTNSAPNHPPWQTIIPIILLTAQIIN